jgi:anti-sigma factor RsiW
MTIDTMDCELFTNSLMAYLEGEVDAGTRVAMERHSVTCDECGALLADLRKLRIDAANLPTMKPSRDLWSGIAARIEAPVLDIGTAGSAPFTAPRQWRRWMRGAMIAASLVAAAGIGYVAAGTRTPEAAPVADGAPETQMRVAKVPDSLPTTEADVAIQPPANSRQPAAGSRQPLPVAAPTQPNEVQVVLAKMTGDYDREIARLRTLIEQRRNQLDPATVAVIEKNLQVIDTAVEDCKKAIARDPASRFLIESLNQSLQTKVELMRTAALLPSRT